MFRSEIEFVRWLQQRLPSRPRGLRLGIGDDAALVEPRRGQELILTADLSVGGVHFSPTLHPPRSVGHRALARSLSDVAAMGGTPRFALVSLVLSRKTSRAWTEAFYEGLLALAARFGVALVGGDTARVDGNTLVDVILTGEIEPGRALERSGARPGDLIFVSGRLGISALGLWLLQSRSRRLPRHRSAPRITESGPAQGLPRRRGRGRTEGFIHAHLYPEPCCALGRFLSTRRLASATIDLSDGLSTDLGRICEASGVGARVWADRIRAPETPEYPPAGLLELALHGGEDYQLLFTVPSRKASEIPARFRGLALHWIGEIRRSKEILLIGPGARHKPLRAAGYDHFRERRRFSVLPGWNDSGAE